MEEGNIALCIWRCSWLPPSDGRRRPSADRMSLLNLVEVSCLVVVLVNLWRMVSQKLRRRPVEWKGGGHDSRRYLCSDLCGFGVPRPYLRQGALTTYLCIAALFVFRRFMKTRMVTTSAP